MEVQTVHALWRTWHPLSKSCPKTDATRIHGALKAHGLDEVLLVVEWAHVSPDERAVFLRDGHFLGVESLLRAAKLPERVEMATSWAMAGKPTQATSPKVSSAPTRHKSAYAAAIAEMYPINEEVY